MVLAGGCALVDGPLPIGDIIAGCILIGGAICVIINITNEARKTPKEIRRELERDYPRHVQKEHVRQKREAREEAKKIGKKPKYPQPYSIRE